MTGIIPDNKYNVTGAIRVLTDEPGDIDSGNCVRGNRPRCGNGPVAAVQDPCVVIAETGGLIGLRRTRIRNGGHFARAISAVITETVDVDVIGARCGRDFELGRSACVVTDVSSEALNRGIARSGDSPFALRISSEAVLTDDVVRRRSAVSGGGTDRKKLRQ